MSFPANSLLMVYPLRPFQAFVLSVAWLAAYLSSGHIPENCPCRTLARGLVAASGTHPGLLPAGVAADVQGLQP